MQTCLSAISNDPLDVLRGGSDKVDGRGVSDRLPVLEQLQVHGHAMPPQFADLEQGRQQVFGESI